MTKRRRIYEGKAKILYDGPEAGTLIQHFKDDVTANNNEKQAVIKGKGVLNNRISEHFFTLLNDLGIPTHFLKRVNMREQLVRAVQIIPLEVVVRNYAAGSICRRLGLEEGVRLPRAIVELYYKDDKLGDPMVSEEHVAAFGWTSVQEFDEITALAVRVNDILSGLIAGAGIRLVDLKLEFGRVFEGENTQIVIADEISPDTCRLWDIQTKKKLDKDRFRNDLGDMIDAYREVAHRLNIIPRAEQTNIQPLTSPRIVK